MTGRRELLRGLCAAAASPLAARITLAGAQELPAGAVAAGTLEALPGKRPLIKRSFRPPNYETPVELLDGLFTPNDAFFVRWHLSNVPRMDAARWRLRVRGEGVRREREFTLAELQRDFEQVELTAVNQCSGNRRGLFTPHVPGIQWGYGGMGNARWRGVRLRDVLASAGIAGAALEVVCDGADAGVLPATPDFAKSLPMAKALDEHTLIAFGMNGEALPHWHGFPARLVVPGWTATYWVKQLTRLDVVTRPFDGFWMKSAYRVPAGVFPRSEEFTSQATAANVPITSMVVNSLVTNVVSGARFPAGRPIGIRGIAWDGGSGIRAVEVSADGGARWVAASLGEDAGRFSWRPWRFQLDAARPGARRLMVRATSRTGEVQPSALVPNPAGYHHNVIQALDLEVA